MQLKKSESPEEAMSFEEVCQALGIKPYHYDFAKAYRQGLVTERIWIEKYLVSNMVLAVAIDELGVKLDVLLRRLSSG